MARHVASGCGAPDDAVISAAEEWKPEAPTTFYTAFRSSVTDGF